MLKAGYFLFIAVPFAIFATACSGSDSKSLATGTAAASAASLPCDVDAVFERCRGCHSATPGFGAPMALQTFADLHAPAHSDPSKKVYELVSKRTHDDVRPMPPPPNARLSSDQLATLDTWIRAGAPASTASSTSCGGDGGTHTPPTLSCAPDVHMSPASPWAMPTDTDDLYVCYGFDVTSAQKRHIVGIAPRVDNRAIIHHLLLFQADESMSSTPRPCREQPASWRIVYGWAPGGGAFEFPPEAGYPQEQTTHYILQIHYNNVLHRPDQKDSSGFDFCTTDQLRPHDADTLAFGTFRFQIPPRATLDLTCDTTMPPGTPDLHLFSAFPHMHQLGTAISTTKLGTAVAPAQDFGTRTSWDFQTQSYQPIQAELKAGDTVETRCVWKNQGDHAVTYGPRTEDEMCFSFTMYWPRINDANWSWVTPTASSRCHPSP